MTGSSRHLRRHLPRALLCAGLGLCATVAVSWACTLWSKLSSPNFPQLGKAQAGIPNLQFQDQFGFGLSYRVAITEIEVIDIVPPSGSARLTVLRNEIEQGKDTLLHQLEAEGLPLPARDELQTRENVCRWKQRWAWEEWRAGWPLKSLCAIKIGDCSEPKFTGVEPPPSRPGLKPPRSRYIRYANPKIIPLFPLWGGLVADTALYSSLLWCCIAAVSGSRRLLRSRRGCCAECGYELAGLTKCPECGTETVKLDFASPVSLSRCLAVSLRRVAVSLLPHGSTP